MEFGLLLLGPMRTLEIKFPAISVEPEELLMLNASSNAPLTLLFEMITFPLLLSRIALPLKQRLA